MWQACCATFESPRIFPRSLADEELGNAAMLPVGERETDASPRTNSPRTTDGKPLPLGTPLGTPLHPCPPASCPCPPPLGTPLHPCPWDPTSVGRLVC